MKILYGVCGEGMGHAMRSSVVARHLESRGHQLVFASRGKALKHLDAHWPGQVIQTQGLGFVMRGTTVDVAASLAKNAFTQLLAVPAHFASWIRMGSARPDVVIVDFEPCSARFARAWGIPLVSVDHIHFVSRCLHPPDVMRSDRAAAALAYPVVDHMTPHAARYLVTTFAAAPVCEPNTTLHLPTIREAMFGLRLRATDGAHVVVYLNEKYDHDQALQTFAAVSGVEFHVYGVPGVREPKRHQNLLLMPFAEATFMGDLAAAGAVIGGAGSLASEAIYLGKPMLALPFRLHFEQILTAYYLQRVGCGERCCELSVDGVRGFLRRAPGYRARAREFKHDNNHELLASVCQALREVTGQPA